MKNITIIGAGPAGLFAAENLIHHFKGSAQITVFDHMPIGGRKFLMAGRGGLNITNSAPLETFINTYPKAHPFLRRALESFTPTDLMNWCEKRGHPPFIGTSGRVFPQNMKATSLLREWLALLKTQGVHFCYGHEWMGWEETDNKTIQLLFKTKEEEKKIIKTDTVLFALGGASWPRLGSTGNWMPLFKEKGIQCAPFEPSNCGFIVPWTDHFSQSSAGSFLKSVTVSFNNKHIQGDLTITTQGLEGGAIYALSSALRQTIKENGSATIHLDLRPQLTTENLVQKLAAPRGSQSLSTHLKKTLHLPANAIQLLHEAALAQGTKLSTEKNLAAFIKALPLKLTAPSSLDRAISSAGGILFDEINEDYSLKKHPSHYVAGEMLDWEAPTGGYLLQACFSTAYTAAQGIIKSIKENGLKN